MDELMTDQQVADYLQITTRTLLRHLTGEARPGFDVKNVAHVTVGGHRRWVRKSLIEEINKKGA